MNDPTVIEEARMMHEAGESTDIILKMLRARGASKVMSIKVLAEIGIPLADAKTIVHDSETWSDVRGAHERFSAPVEDVLDKNESRQQ